jgi:pimeloyl-ACP methyl ester carboxylesterase
MRRLDHQPKPIALENLFVRESGQSESPAIVFLHGGELSGRSWQPVVDQLQQYRCLVPDLPQHGESVHPGPFDIGVAANAVAELIRSHEGIGQVHLVGLSLGAQVGVQLLATAPELVDRAVLCGTIINALPGVRLTASLVGAVALISRSVTLRRKARPVRAPAADIADYREDVRLMPAAQIARLVEASTGFTVPEGLEKSESQALFLSGSKELRFVRRSAAALAQRMPNGVDGIAIAMNHDWPLRNSELFARTVDGWVSGAELPSGIALSNMVSR